jgi:serine/threonine-protein kinase RsbW
MNDARAVNVRADLWPTFAGRGAGSLLEIDAWIPSEISAISPLVERLMRLVEGSHCVTGEETAVELALLEALSNAVVHGNRLDAHKLVHVRCRCKGGKGISITVSDQGQGFDPSAVADPLSVDNLDAEYGRGIHLMKLAMDEVSFKQRGAEVHMWKGPANDVGARMRS